MRVLRATLIVTVLASFASAAIGQTTSNVPQSPATDARAIACRATLSPVRAVLQSGTFVPYSAVREYSTVQTLANGTHIAHKPSTEKIYCDSQGRIRTERPFCQGTVGQSGAEIVEIQDPVSGYSYILDGQNRVAYRYTSQVRPIATPLVSSKVDATQPKPAPTVAAGSIPREEETSESLGTQTMEGVLAEGVRITQVIPVDAEDNDGPITVVSEVWNSPDLKIPILSKRTDPRNGESTMRLTNIDLSQPILSLFQPPADYKVVDQADRVTLTFTRQR